MTDFPKDGSTFVVESIDRTAYKWAKYKPDGVRQMGVPGRWQKQVWSGDWFKWENCDEPTGELSPPIEDGPITKAFKESGALDHWRQEVGKKASRIDTLSARIEELETALKTARECLDGQPEYHHSGMGCGLEDRNIRDRYQAMEHGWECAMERVYGEHIIGAVEVIDAALDKDKPNG